MRAEVMQHYGLSLPLNQAGYFETAHHQQLIKDIKGAIFEGRLIALCGVIGSGKTVMLRRLQQAMEEEKKITVSKSLAIEKHSIKLATFIAALFYDLSTEKQVRIPTLGEKRERDLRELVRKNKRPVALFVDEAHDLNGHTLTGLKRLMELVEDGNGRLSIVLAGHLSYVTTCADQRWRKSATAPTSSRSTASPAVRGNTFIGCWKPAPRERSNPSRS